MNDKVPFNGLLVYIINNLCNLKCNYCIAKDTLSKKPYNKNLEIKKILKILDDTKKTYLIVLSGGEPFLVENFVEACKELSKKHYIGINTNLTSDKVKNFADSLDPNKVYYVVASLHMKELERLKLVKKYLDNVKYLKNKGFKVYTNEVAFPGLKKEIKKYLKYYKKKGLDVVLTPYYGVYNNKNYSNSYTDEELEIFKLSDNSRNHFICKGKPCNIGYNAAFMNYDGKILGCLRNEKIIGNLNTGINFSKNPKICEFDYCTCPIRNTCSEFYDDTFYNFNKNIFRKKLIRINYFFNSLKIKIFGF